MSAFGFVFLRQKMCTWGFCGGVKQLKKALQYFIYKNLRALLNLVHLFYCAKLVMKLKEQHWPQDWWGKGWK